MLCRQRLPQLVLLLDLAQIHTIWFICDHGYWQQVLHLLHCQVAHSYRGSQRPSPGIRGLLPQWQALSLVAWLSIQASQLTCGCEAGGDVGMGARVPQVWNEPGVPYVAVEILVQLVLWVELRGCRAGGSWDCICCKPSRRWWLCCSWSIPPEWMHVGLLQGLLC